MSEWRYFLYRVLTKGANEMFARVFCRVLKKSANMESLLLLSPVWWSLFSVFACPATSLFPWENQRVNRKSLGMLPGIGQSCLTIPESQLCACAPADQRCRLHFLMSVIYLLAHGFSWHFSLRGRKSPKSIHWGMWRRELFPCWGSWILPGLCGPLVHNSWTVERKTVATRAIGG